MCIKVNLEIYRGDIYLEGEMICDKATQTEKSDVQMDGLEWKG